MQRAFGHTRPATYREDGAGQGGYRVAQLLHTHAVGHAHRHRLLQLIAEQVQLAQQRPAENEGRQTKAPGAVSERGGMDWAASVSNSSSSRRRQRLPPQGCSGAAPSSGVGSGARAVSGAVWIGRQGMFQGAGPHDEDDVSPPPRGCDAFERRRERKHPGTKRSPCAGGRWQLKPAGQLPQVVLCHSHDPRGAQRGVRTQSSSLASACHDAPLTRTLGGWMGLGPNQLVDDGRLVIRHRLDCGPQPVHVTRHSTRTRSASKTASRV